MRVSSNAPFLPLRHRRFAALWCAGLVSFLGTWVHNVAARWTAATLSPSPAWVTAVDTLQLAPMMVLSLAAGVLADSTDRRRLLVTVNLGLAGVAGAMAWLAASGHLSLATLLTSTAAMGVLGALNGPAWQATVPRQVPDAEVPHAVALMSTGFNLARAVGPGVGAWMLVRHGPAWAFAANGASFVLIAGLLATLPAQPGSAERTPFSPRQDAGLMRLYAAVLAFGVFAMPSLSLLPVAARDGLHGDASTYGRLLSAFGVGAVMAGLGVAWGARRLGIRPFVGATCLASAAGLAWLSLAPDLGQATGAAAVCGAGWIGTISTINAAVQLRTPRGARGRAMAFYLTFAVGGQALGSFLAGQAATRLGYATALQACAVALVCLAGAAVWATRDHGPQSGQSG
jgi:predicted MFS family arabinose efflux permease